MRSWFREVAILLNPTRVDITSPPYMYSPDLHQNKRYFSPGLYQYLFFIPFGYHPGSSMRCQPDSVYGGSSLTRRMTLRDFAVSGFSAALARSQLFSNTIDISEAKYYQSPSFPTEPSGVLRENAYHSRSIMESAANLCYDRVK
jgi:hypothetical protein